MPTEHPNVVLSRQHFDLMVDQYDDCVWKHFARAVVYGERPAQA